MLCYLLLRTNEITRGNMMLILGEKIKQSRTLKEWTQEDLAHKIGTTKHVISNWERSKANPDPVQIIKLATTFEVSADYLLGLSDYPEPHFRDPFGQLYFLPAIDYSFIKGMSWDLLKLINSGITLTINNDELSSLDKKMLVELTNITFNRLKEVVYQTREETLKASSQE